MDQRTKLLTNSINKLLRRGAERNIRRIINKTHEADVASVLESLDTEGRISVFQLIPDQERQARILSHLKKKYQLEVAHIFEITQLQQLLSFMDSDDAADLLGHLPEELSQEALRGLNRDELQEVEELMSYPEDSAGGLMGSEFLTIDEDLKVREAIEKIQSMDEDLISFYVYVVNGAKTLVGVLSLKQLLLSRPQESLKNIMSTDVISVNIATSQNEVARIVEKYDFLSLPVIDDNNNLVGVITVDDVIDVIREEAAEDIQAMGMGGADMDESHWTHIKARLPWLGLASTGGLFCFFMLWKSLKPFKIDTTVVHAICLLPLVFFVVSSLSNQTVTMLVGLWRGHGRDMAPPWPQLKKEFLVGLSLSLLLSLLFMLIFGLTQEPMGVPVVFGLLLGLQMLFALFISMGVPLLMGRLNLDPIISGPSVMILSNICAVGILVLSHALW